MILGKLKEIEKDATSKIRQEENRLKTAENFRMMLNEIDFTYELVRTNDPEKLIRLMSSLKKGPLNGSEKKIINEINNLNKEVGNNDANEI